MIFSTPLIRPTPTTLAFPIALPYLLVSIRSLRDLNCLTLLTPKRESSATDDPLGSLSGVGHAVDFEEVGFGDGAGVEGGGPLGGGHGGELGEGGFGDVEVAEAAGEVGGFEELFEAAGEALGVGVEVGVGVGAVAG